ncbi:hypothetical protein BGX38DRAFT_1272127 [Terfezia claveryi]|nr:hypothetical protein BGX38DRAFT_1272127 [Terfezia claveryi]
MIECIATEAQQNQIMGHTHGSVFQKHYISYKIRVDTQAAFLGSKPQMEIGEISRTMDHRSSTELSMDEMTEVEASPALQEMAAEISAYRQELVDKYGSARRGCAPREAVDKLKRLAARRRSQLKRHIAKALEKKRESFDIEISNLEIASQLTGRQLDLDLKEEELCVPKELVDLFKKGLFHELVVALIDLLRKDKEEDEGGNEGLDEGEDEGGDEGGDE